ncbi:MFS transporter, putative metabolite:H+ symporter [Burkholderia sp. WP9]|jgi:putative MFS transporter|uniref:MFS transporter n=1 Tax=Burkholderia sp. WP9 TaxID=1500263 RepID=UPI00089DA068|nr:MFS transporter [Burkholderia sp. WP9]SEE69656.1 MFS transporter, putative metabolite:H+ symporter [Burkholderia sp. WP9]
MYTVSERLERLPFSRFHFKLLIIGGLGLAFEALDAGIIAFILPSLRVKWGLTGAQTGWIASSTYVGFMAGALLSGLVGDRFGRKVVMMWALLLFCVATFANAFATNFHEFYILRMIAGVGMGAEGAIIAPYLAEFVSSRYRGRFTGALAGFFSFGFVLSALLGYLVVPTGPDGWRYLMILAALPVVLLLWMRRALFESPRWLEQVGRHDEAARACDAIEAQVTLATGQPLPAVQRLPHDTATAGAIERSSFFGRLAVLFKPQYLTTTIVVWVFWIAVIFCYYAFLVWIPSLLVSKGFTITKSFSFTILIYLAQVPGYYSAAYLNDRIGRKYTILAYMLVSCLAALGLAFAVGDTQIILYSLVLSFGMNGVVAGQYTYTAEVYPTHIRATGMGTASALARIGSIASPTIVGAAYPLLGFAGVFVLITAVLIVGGLGILLFGKNTQGAILEGITE